jgi:hypothetical protein
MVPEPASLVNGLTWHFADYSPETGLLRFQRVPRGTFLGENPPSDVLRGTFGQKARDGGERLFYVEHSSVSAAGGGDLWDGPSDLLWEVDAGQECSTWNNAQSRRTPRCFSCWGVPRGTFLLPAGWNRNGLRLTSGLFYVEHLGRREPARNRPVALFHVEHSADGQTSGTKRACRPETVWRRVHNVLRGTSAR